VRRLLLLLLLLFPAVAGAEEEEEEAIGKLPGCLRPGAAGTFSQGPGEGRLRGTLEYRVVATDIAGTVRIESAFSTADLGPLTTRYRLSALLDARARRFSSFTYEVGGSDPKVFRLLARLGPDPDRAGGFLHEKFRYDAAGEARVTKSRPKLPAAFTLDLLAPFTVGLAEPAEDGSTSLTVFTVERGRVLREPVVLRPMGAGKMEISGVDVPCRILVRVKGDDRSAIYLRESDFMPLRYGTTEYTPAQ
jgi:hypothetical protein